MKRQQPMFSAGGKSRACARSARAASCAGLLPTPQLPKIGILWISRGISAGGTVEDRSTCPQSQICSGCVPAQYSTCPASCTQGKPLTRQVVNRLIHRNQPRLLSLPVLIYLFIFKTVNHLNQQKRQETGFQHDKTSETGRIWPGSAFKQLKSRCVVVTQCVGNRLISHLAQGNVQPTAKVGVSP